MKPEEIILEEMDKFSEWLEMVEDIQTSAFLVPILANRCSAAESMVTYLKRRLERFENGRNPTQIESENG